MTVRGDDLDKSNLRSNIIEKLKTLSAAERKNIEQSLEENLLTSEIWKQSSVIGITISHGFEWNTKSIIEAAWQNGKKVCVPKCQHKERKMDFYLINNNDQLEVDNYHLQKPTNKAY